jgi:6-phosphogluconolactonase
MKKNCITIAVTFMLLTMQAQKTNFNLLVGTYTTKCDSKGIYVYDFDTKTAEFKLKNTTNGVVNPSYLGVSTKNDFVYSVNENGKESTVSAFSYSPITGTLDFINKEVAQGADPCYLINDTKNVIVANYSGGNIAVFGINNDGSLTKSKQVVNHKGSSINSKRQDKPHAHMVYFSPDKKYVLSNDLGTDKIYIYRYNADSEDKILVASDSIAVKSGSGPRHLTFSKNGKFVYLLHELNGGLTVFAYTKGKLVKIQETTILAKEYNGAVGAADIHLSPDGLFLYATNRGEANSITIFKVLKNGLLETKVITSTLGKGPRNFVIDPSGNYLLVGHHYSNEIVIFKRDKVSGLLSNTGKRIELCAPVCLVFTNNK